MARRAIALALITTTLLAAGAVLPKPALALTLETAPGNPDGTPKFTDPDQKFERFNDGSSNRDRDSDRNGNPPGLSFGSQDSGLFTFSVRRPDQSDPFDNRRFFGPDPTRRW